jgi:glycosyltransferase involved in cell wall biosynthesis
VRLLGEKISVIVAAYNVEGYIKKCIESILMQNYKSIEIILVDDGSTDKTGELCRRLYLDNPNEIKLIRQENCGLSAARNLALSVATGDYITFVDGDDYLEKNALTTLYRAIRRDRADIACAGFFEEMSGYKREINFRTEDISFERIMEKISERDGYKFVVVWGKLYRRELFRGLSFPNGRLHEDQYIIHELYYRSRKTVCVSQRLYHHINREGGISRSHDFSKHTDDLDALSVRADFLKSVGRCDSQIFVARHMCTLLEYYLKNSHRGLANREKCKYIKRLLSFARATFGKGSEVYKSALKIYRRNYYKYKMLACIYG